jgi:hypothetical protein
MPWRRTICLFFGLAAAGAFTFTRPAENALAKWEQDIRAFEAADRTNSPPRNAVLFIGSSSIRMWKSLAEDFKGMPVINRGFGGSQMTDSVFYADRIVIPYHPREIVVYAGDNDVAAGRTPQQVLGDFQAFVAKIRAALPGMKICYIAIKPSPARWKLVEQAREANRRIAQWTRTQAGLEFIDVFTPMLGEDGQPRAELLAKDKLHLNEKGYQLWTSIVRPYLTP